jgi:DNA-binding transcriptional LysR family regulator
MSASDRELGRTSDRRNPNHLTSLTQLQAFVTVVKFGSFTRAAAELGISQPGISELIRRLELDLSSTLILRRGVKFELTSAGQKLLPHAEQAVASARQAVKAVRSEP